MNPLSSRNLMCKPRWKRNLCMSLSPRRIILDFGTSFHKDNFEPGIFNRHPRPLGHGIWLLLKWRPMNFTYIPLQTCLQGKDCSQVGVSIGKTISMGGQAGHQATLNCYIWRQQECSENCVLPTLSHLYSPPEQSNQYSLLQAIPRQSPLAPSKKQKLLRPGTWCCWMSTGTHFLVLHGGGGDFATMERWQEQGKKTVIRLTHPFDKFI